MDIIATSACTESEALSNAGHDVSLLTFNGLIDDTVRPNIRMINILDANRRDIVNKINSHELTKWPFMFVSCITHTNEAAWLFEKEGFDVVHLRDADPFPFLPRLIGLFTRNTKWVVSLLATLERVPVVGPLSRFSTWSVVYQISLANSNRYLYVCQNDRIKAYYSKEFLNGILDGSVFELSPMISNLNTHLPGPSETEAKIHLGLPSEKRIFLSFGSAHKGKDSETIFSAIESLPNVLCIHAGKTTSNMISSFERLKTRYNRNVMYVDRYIPETEKPYYFAASSAIILSYTKDFNATSSMLWEACRFKVPVIACESAELGSAVRSFGLGLTFVSQNPDSLREAILKFMTLDDKTIATMKNNCDRFCSCFSGVEWATKCLELYRKLRTD